MEMEHHTSTEDERLRHAGAVAKQRRQQADEIMHRADALTA
jgi:hypothetical protein